MDPGLISLRAGRKEDRERVLSKSMEASQSGQKLFAVYNAG